MTPILGYMNQTFDESMWVLSDETTSNLKINSSKNIEILISPLSEQNSQRKFTQEFVFRIQIGTCPSSYFYKLNNLE